MKTTIGEIRERANSVLDGMTTHRTRVARDCLILCDEVQRLREELAAAKRMDAAPKVDFESIFGKKAA